METIRKGSKGDAVKQWQKILGITADGSFGPMTEASTMAFQRSNKLTADGVVGPMTWAAATHSTATTMPVAAAVATPKEQVSTPPSSGQYPSDGTPADLEAMNVYMVNAAANTGAAAGLRASWLAWFSGLSWFDKSVNTSSSMQDARARRDAFNLANARSPVEVAVVQRVIAQSVDSPVVDQVNKNAVSHPTIREGSQGPAVTDWQNVLALSPADGQFGPAVTAATKAFQSSRGLESDGIVGPKTWMTAYASHAATTGGIPPAAVVDSTGAYPPAAAPPMNKVTPTGPTGGRSVPATTPPKAIVTPPQSALKLSLVETQAAVQRAEAVAKSKTGIGGGIGTLGGAGVGFAMGGPVGALVGGLIGAGAGALVGSRLT